MPVTDLEPLFLGRWTRIARLRLVMETAIGLATSERGPLRGLALTRSIGRSLGLLRDPGRAVQVELEDSRNHNEGLRLIAIFKKGEPKRRCAVSFGAASGITAARISRGQTARVAVTRRKLLPHSGAAK